MIVCGIFSAIVGVTAVLSISALAALAGSTKDVGFLYASSIIVTVVSVIEVIAGVKGLKACKAPETAKKCVTWGVIIVAVSNFPW